MAKIALVSFDPLSGNLPDCHGPLEGLRHANGSSEFIEQEIFSEINYSPSTPTKLKRVRSRPALRQVLGVVLSSTALERDALWGGPYSSAV
jgi:hypothetical protein